jgi:hypothetical protein
MLFAGIKQPMGSLLSVALSLSSRWAGVTRHLALWSPDFPQGSLLNIVGIGVLPCPPCHC